MSLSVTCACGATSGTAVPTEQRAHACHCSTCRKWSGGVFLSVTCEDVELEGKPNVWVSSDWGERVSCGVCGSALVWRMRDGSFQSVSIQAFEDPGQFPLTEEIMIDHKPAGYDFTGGHDRLTQAEVMARHAPEPEATP